MCVAKENPNNLQIEEAKSTRPKDAAKLKAKLYKETQRKQPKKVAGNKDEGSADETPFDSKSNNMNQKR